MEEGSAVVEKTVANTSRPCSKEIGQLKATAIIGDVALVGAKIPRPATVRALNVTEEPTSPKRLTFKAFFKDFQ